MSVAADHFWNLDPPRHRAVFAGDLIASGSLREPSVDFSLVVGVGEPMGDHEDVSVLLAPMHRVASRLYLSSTRLLDGEPPWAMWLPDWYASSNRLADWYGDLRGTHPLELGVDAATLRVASMTGPAWLVLMDRIARFFTGLPVDAPMLVVEHALRHPDAPTEQLRSV